MNLFVKLIVCSWIEFVSSFRIMFIISFVLIKFLNVLSSILVWTFEVNFIELDTELVDLSGVALI